MRIDYHPAIAAELKKIRDYYNSQSDNLGLDFVNEFDKQVLHIATMPDRWMRIRGDVRRALMKRFPYVIFFRIVDNKTIRITIVKHEKRHPSFGIFRRSA